MSIQILYRCQFWISKENFSIIIENVVVVQIHNCLLFFLHCAYGISLVHMLEAKRENVVFFCHNFCVSYIWCGQGRCQKIGRYQHIRIYLWLRIFLFSSPTSSKKVKVHVCNLTLYQTINQTNPPILLSFFQYFVHISGRQREANFCLWIINLQKFGELVFGIPYFFDIRFSFVVVIFFNFLLANFLKPSGFKFCRNYRCRY